MLKKYIGEAMNRRWDYTLKNDGFNNMTYHQLFWDIGCIRPREENDDSSLMVLNKIERFTMKPCLYNLLAKKSEFSYQKVTKQYQYNGDIKVSFQLLSNNVSSRKDKKELKSALRYGKCHIKTLELSSKIKDSKVLTGYVFKKDLKYLHSILEVNDDIWDWTKNIIMPKEDYFRLTNFQELSSIESEKIISDQKIIEKLNLSLKAYTLFRDEIMLDIAKNKTFFKEKESRYIK